MLQNLYSNIKFLIFLPVLFVFSCAFWLVHRKHRRNDRFTVRYMESAGKFDYLLSKSDFEYTEKYVSSSLFFLLNYSGSKIDGLHYINDGLDKIMLEMPSDPCLFVDAQIISYMAIDEYILYSPDYEGKSEMAAKFLNRLLLLAPLEIEKIFQLYEVAKDQYENKRAIHYHLEMLCLNAKYEAKKSKEKYKRLSQEARAGFKNLKLLKKSHKVELFS